MNSDLKLVRLLLDGKAIVTAVLLMALLANSTPLPELPRIVAGSMSKNQAFLRQSLDGDMVNAITDSLNFELTDPADKQLLEESLETAIRELNAGKPGRITTTEDFVNSLSGKTAHGDLFETLAARSDHGKYVGINNLGVDYVRSDPASPKRWILSQAKAYKSATQSAQEAMGDSLEFIGGSPRNRLEKLINDKNAFEAVIPSDQFENLKLKGMITPEGKPSEKLIEQTLQAAAKSAVGTGDKAARIKAALATGRGKDIVSRVIVRPGPVTYDELRTMTSRAQTVLKRLSIALRNPIVNAVGKTAGVVAVVASAPIMLAKLDDLDSSKIDGTVTEEQVDRETFAIYGTAGLSAGVGVALLVFTPAGWVGVAVVGAGALTCWLVDDTCFQCLYDKVIQTEQAKLAFIELRKLRGERAAHLSGFSIPPEMIINVDERGSYELAWKNAGSPPIQLPSEIKERDFELKDTRMWVQNKPTENDILQFKLLEPTTTP